MIKPIVRDVFFLGQKSEPATKQDAGIGMDLPHVAVKPLALAMGI